MKLTFALEIDSIETVGSWCIWLQLTNNNSAKAWTPPSDIMGSLYLSSKLYRVRSPTVSTKFISINFLPKSRMLCWGICNCDSVTSVRSTIDIKSSKLNSPHNLQPTTINNFSINPQCYWPTARPPHHSPAPASCSGVSWQVPQKVGVLSDQPKLSFSPYVTQLMLNQIRNNMQRLAPNNTFFNNS